MSARPQRVPKVELEHDTSQYMIEGRRVVSVTEALALAGMVDFSGIPERILDHAAHRGKLVHALTEHDDLGYEVDLRAALEAAPYVTAWRQFRRDADFQPDLSEHLVVSVRHRYAGTLDRVGHIGGDSWLIDIKTSVNIPPWAGMQTALYREALTESGDWDPKPQRGVVHLKKDGTYRFEPLADHADIANGLAAVRVANWLLDNGRYEL